ncbi:hypothetical protein [Lactobacillus sp. PSON]|uniref:hypothetical protein n=1 Tax=Lactobacillus sp. PSON TaxID=3455454 RepID=UPI00404267FC
MPKEKTKTKTTETKASEYTKQNLVESKIFSISDRDILNIVLKDDKKYTLKEAKKAINNFKGGI